MASPTKNPPKPLSDSARQKIATRMVQNQESTSLNEGDQSTPNQVSPFQIPMRTSMIQQGDEGKLVAPADYFKG